MVLDYVVGGLSVVFGLIFIFTIMSWYKVVPPSEAHLVVTPSKKMVVSTDLNVRKGTNKNTYFAVPSWVVGFGRSVRRMDVTIKELLLELETVERNQARFAVASSLKYRILNVEKAAETYTNDEELKSMLKEVVIASVTAVTVLYDVTDARAKKHEISEKIKLEMKDDLEGWGLELVSFQLIHQTDSPAFLIEINNDTPP